jgi:hypothetical protein
VQGDQASELEVKIRFLHLFERPPEGPGEPAWQEAVEREIVAAPTIAELLAVSATLPFALPADDVPGRQMPLEGRVLLSAALVSDGVFRLGIGIENLTPAPPDQPSRDELLLHSMVATHTLLRVEGGGFISLTDPPAPFQQAAAACSNVGTWPALAGDPRSRNTMLSSPIIVSDYPSVAPESPGDFFDGTEMDEMLSLRILTLTDDEKREMREADERARRLLERTEACTAEDFLRLHGALRPVRMPGESP